jgi:hypothetical protein
MSYFDKKQFKQIRSIKDIDKRDGNEFEYFCKFLLEDHLDFKKVQVTPKKIKGS